MARLARRGHRQSAARARARYLLARLMERAREQGVGVPAMVTTDYINTIPPEQEPWFPGDEVHRAPHPRVHPLERGGDGRPRRTTASTASAVTCPRTRRRPRSTRSASTTSSAARATAATATRCSSRATPRPASTPARSSRAASPRSSSTASGARSTAAACRRTRTRGACPTFWEFPTVSMGLGPLNAVVPGPLQPLPLQPRDRRHQRARRCGASSATARWTSPRRWPALSTRGARAARQPDLRRQLQPAAPRRSGARQRQGHPGARGDRSAARAGT